MTTTQEQQFTLEEAVAAIRVLVLQVNDQGDDVAAGGKWGDVLCTLIHDGEGPDFDVLVGLYQMLGYLESRRIDGWNVPTREDRSAAIKSWGTVTLTRKESIAARRWKVAVEDADIRRDVKARQHARADCKRRFQLQDRPPLHP